MASETAAAAGTTLNEFMQRHGDQYVLHMAKEIDQLRAELVVVLFANKRLRTTHGPRGKLCPECRRVSDGE